MESLSKEYTAVFNAITDAIRAMDSQNFGIARELLVRAQQQAEEEFLSAEE